MLLLPDVIFLSDNCRISRQRFTQWLAEGSEGSDGTCSTISSTLMYVSLQVLAKLLAVVRYGGIDPNSPTLHTRGRADEKKPLVLFLNTAIGVRRGRPIVLARIRIISTRCCI